MIRVFKHLQAIILFLGICIPTVYAQFGQERVNVAIAWEDEWPVLQDITLNDRINTTIIQSLSGVPMLAFQFPLNNDQSYNYTIADLQWKGGNAPFDFDLRSSVEATEGIARKIKSGTLLIPISVVERSSNYHIERISVTLTKKRAETHSSATHAFRGATNSVLNSGEWYKFGIESTGIYQLSFEFLQSLGIDAAGIPHSNFRIYGQEGGMLPRRAGDERTDDLIELPIRVVASGSTLQSGDYLIFYGEGPEKWTYDDEKGRFTHEHHLYSNLKSYFITSDLGPGQRVPNANPLLGVADVVFEEFWDHQYIEEDIYNLNKSGTDWLGDEFSVDLQKTYSFNFADLITSREVVLDYRLASRSTSGSSTFEILHNGAEVAFSSIGSVSGTYTGDVARAVSSDGIINAGGDLIDVVVKYNPANFSASGWLDYLSLNAIRKLEFNGNDLHFRHTENANENLVEFRVSGMNSGVEIWDVTDQFNSTSVNYSLAGDQASFNAAGNRIGEFVAFSGGGKIPTAIGRVDNQDLHGLADADMIIITRESMIGPSNELAQFHRDEEGFDVHVVLVEQIFNEFASGNNDVTAIRDFLKMFYDRNDNYPKYVCLLGDGTFNNRELGNYFVPTFESDITLVTLHSLVTDDYFVFLDDDEGEDVNSNSNLLDMAIGRIPADNLTKANIAVEKIKRYYDQSGFGSWRNVGTFIADDEDLDLHFRDGELIANEFFGDNPIMNMEKIYLDAFRQVAGAGGELYPDVNRAINNRIFKGTLFLNYIGHGGGNGMADERVITLEDIDSWDNPDKLTLIISATCEFTRYDDFERYSAGERAFFRQDGGAIAMVTTVRLVFSNKNREMNQSFMNAFEQGFADKDLTLGDFIRIAKNNTPTGRGNRKFTLIGDPALRIAIPALNVQTTQINSNPYVTGNDTLKALTLVNIEGEVTTNSGDLLDDFNGLVYPTVFDKEKTLFTLANDERSSVKPFQTQNSIIYAGKIQAIGGKFNYSFVVPRDIVYSVGDGKISYYAHDDLRDAAGIDTVLVGGGGQLDSNSIDSDDPIVDVFMDDETWISGDFTDKSPDLLVNLFDQNGINTVGSGVGHDIVAVLDDDTENGIILNDFYESELNSFQEGSVLYPLEGIETGTHTIRVKAWDVFNNSGEGITEFVVAEDAGLALDHVLNYPNPFTTNTTFMFEHNRKGDVLDVRIEVFTVSGKVVKTIQATEPSDERRVEIAWDGLDDYGDRIGRGVYIYRVTLKDSAGEKVDEFQKLVLLR